MDEPGKRELGVWGCCFGVLAIVLYAAVCGPLIPVTSSQLAPVTTRLVTTPLKLLCVQGPDCLAKPYLEYIRWRDPQKAMILGWLRTFEKRRAAGITSTGVWKTEDGPEPALPAFPETDQDTDPTRE